MKVLYSGGGTLGAVSPLFAIHAYFLSSRASEASRGISDYQGIWVGRQGKIEEQMAAERGMRVRSILGARFRHFEGERISLAKIFFPFAFIIAFFQSLWLLLREMPDVHVTCGSFVSVPMTVACWALGIPTVVHQQDLIPGSANKLMARFAKKVTVAFPELVSAFGAKAVLTGNPVRPEVLQGNAEAARAHFNLRETVPTILVIGGSSGAQALNGLVEAALPKLVVRAQVLHMRGSQTEPAQSHRYRAAPFLGSAIANAYALADVVVARAGLSTMSEVGVLGKPVILVPIPGSHQEKNAEYFASRGAALIASQTMDPNEFGDLVLALLHDEGGRANLSNNAKQLFPSDAAARCAQVMIESSHS